MRDDGHERAADLLQRDFTAMHPNQRWVGDFTHVMTWAGVVYVLVTWNQIWRRVVLSRVISAR
ncbi:hypothetical protein Mth01_55530 [Sphaerimonospora thailandensis]|uniref:Integrase-like protein n=1 Tax=Sphaerimonospora thailandensis TaxID=795644 RepID=A0A8J3REK4_9ACTN|nr:hypothetical protein Mth01_55530 [Sphaerimonospora thailandensis]